MKNIFKLNNVKFFAAAIAICGASLLGYNAYSNATMTDQERLLQQNLEALTDTEDGNDCKFVNGYSIFTSRNGGGYDCCKVWKDLRPDESSNCITL